jgi:hypothetical protein
VKQVSQSVQTIDKGAWIEGAGEEEPRTPVAPMAHPAQEAADGSHSPKSRSLGEATVDMEDAVIDLQSTPGHRNEDSGSKEDEDEVKLQVPELNHFPKAHLELEPLPSAGVRGP